MQIAETLWPGGEQLQDHQFPFAADHAECDIDQAGEDSAATAGGWCIHDWPLGNLPDGESILIARGVPTLHEWAGGDDAFVRLTEVFYQRVAKEPLLAPLFAHMGADHSRLVAAFIGEVPGGPTLYSQERGGHHAMIMRHLGKHLTEAQRARWMCAAGFSRAACSWGASAEQLRNERFECGLVARRERAE